MGHDIIYIVGGVVIFVGLIWGGAKLADYFIEVTGINKNGWIPVAMLVALLLAVGVIMGLLGVDLGGDDRRQPRASARTEVMTLPM